MKSKFAASALMTLLYCQGLLGFAGLATVLIKDRAAEVTHQAQLPAADEKSASL